MRFESFCSLFQCYEVEVMARVSLSQCYPHHKLYEHSLPVSGCGWCLHGALPRPRLIYLDKRGPARGSRVSASSRNSRPTTEEKPAAGKRTTLESLWREFFSDPSEWWDNRPEKENSRYPDFKHKKTKDGLWLDNRLNPPWVVAQLAAMKPVPMQMDIYAWNRKLARYLQTGLNKKVLGYFRQMQQDGIRPDAFSFVQAIRACTNLRALKEGRNLHALVVRANLASDLYVGSCLVDMYAKCRRIKDARGVFDKMPRRSTVSWSAMILGYVKCGRAEEALELGQQMQVEGLQPGPAIFVGMLNACATLTVLEEGRRIHKQVIDQGHESEMFVCNSLIDMYGKCGSMDDACQVFEKMPRRDVISWNTLTASYVRCKQGQKALELLERMQEDGLRPDAATYVGMLNACASVNALEEGKQLHARVIENGFSSNDLVQCALVDMYSKCGNVEDAWAEQT